MNLNINFMIRRATFEGWQILPRTIQDYELVYILHGYGKITIADRQILVKGGDLILFRPGITHSLKLSQEPYMEFYGLHFFPQEEDLMGQIPDHIYLESGHWLEVLMRDLYEEYQQKRYLGNWKQEIILQQILYEILTKQHSEQEPISNIRIRKVLAYIHEDPCREYTLNDLLNRTGIKKTLFMQSFRNVTGTTPMHYIIDLRLEHAMALLTETDLQVFQISEKCGFSDPFYFSRCFKKRFSLSPRQYRDYKK